MVGIVVVSHSNAIVQGIIELIQQMTQGQAALAGAGGIDDPAHPLGTDAMKIFEAILSVYSDDGVVVLIDLGSALLSTEVALDFLEPEQREHVVLCAAPLVEGSIAAAVQASVGASLEEVVKEAMSAYTVKQTQFPDYEPPAAEESNIIPQSDAIIQVMTIPNRLGLHARPAARFVATVNRYQADVTLQKVGTTRIINAKSINQVVTLGLRQGDKAEIRASGADANAVLAAIQALIDDNLGDNDDAPAPEKPAAKPAEDAGGIAASPGYALGKALILDQIAPQVDVIQVEDTQAEWERLQSVIQSVKQDLAQTVETLIKRGKAKEAEIFEAHQLILQDPELTESVRVKLNADRINAEAAWQASITAMAEAYRQVEDDYIRERADDIHDIGQKVLLQLMDLEVAPLEIAEPSIVVANTLSPSDTALFTPDKVLGIIVGMGGATSHSAILARSMGIPAIVGIGDAIQQISDGQQVGLDGYTGQFWVDPSAEIQQRLTDSLNQWRAKRQELQANALKPAVTQDGHQVMVAANIGADDDAQRAVDLGAEGVGLLRSELLFMERENAPSEEEQFQAYRAVGSRMGERPVIIRTLDIGGDKPLPYLNLPEEENPFLGWRGIRLTLDNPDLFKTQLRAILRASSQSNLALMFPMVSTVAEVRAGKALLESAKAELRAKNIPFDAQIRVGIMIEVPAAVAIADHLAKEVDFFSIGTNDLTQYLMAADRGNTQVNKLANALEPAVLRSIKQIIDAAHLAKIDAYMCGELASNPLAIPLLVGMGLDELSVGVAAIPETKEIVRRMNMKQAVAMVKDVLSQSAVDEVIAILEA